MLRMMVGARGNSNQCLCHRGLRLTGRLLRNHPRSFTPRDGILPAYYTFREDSGQETTIVAFYVTRDSGTTWTYNGPGLSARGRWPLTQLPT